MASVPRDTAECPCSGCTFPSWPVRRRGRAGKPDSSQTAHRIGDAEARSSGTLLARVILPPRPVPPGLRDRSPARPGKDRICGPGHPPSLAAGAGRVQNKSGGRGRGGGGAEAIRGGGRRQPSRPCSPGADGSGRRAPRRGLARPPAPAAAAAAAPAAAAAAGPGPAAAGECPPSSSTPRPAPPSTPRGAGSQSWIQGGAREWPGAARYPETLSGCPGGVVDSELPVPGSMQVKPAPGSLGLAGERAGLGRALDARRQPPSSQTCPLRARPAAIPGVCVCCRGGTAGVATGLPTHRRDKDPRVPSWRQPPGVWPR